MIRRTPKSTLSPHTTLFRSDIAVLIEPGGPARRYDAGRIVFLDDAGAGIRRAQIAAVDHSHLMPACRRPEISLPRRRRDRDVRGEPGGGRLGGARCLGNAADIAIA